MRTQTAISTLLVHAVVASCNGPPRFLCLDGTSTCAPNPAAGYVSGFTSSVSTWNCMDNRFAPVFMNAFGNAGADNESATDSVSIPSRTHICTVDRLDCSVRSDVIMRRISACQLPPLYTSSRHSLIILSHAITVFSLVQVTYTFNVVPTPATGNSTSWWSAALVPMTLTWSFTVRFRFFLHFCLCL